MTSVDVTGVLIACFFQADSTMAQTCTLSGDCLMKLFCFSIFPNCYDNNRIQAKKQTFSYAPTRLHTMGESIERLQHLIVSKYTPPGH